MSVTSHLGDFHFKNNLIFFIKLNIHLTCSLVIPLLGIYSSDIRTGSHKNLYINIYLYKTYVASLIFTPKGKQHKCLLPGKSINKMWYSHKWLRVHSSSMKRIKLLIHTAWMNIKCIMGSERSQSLFT